MRPSTTWATVTFLGGIVGSALISCSDPEGPVWEDAGEHREMIAELVVVGPMTVNDTLTVFTRGFSTHGSPTDCRWESTRTAHNLDLTLWVRSERWVGSSPPPPYDLEFECNLTAVPPFEAGYFSVVVFQPDGSQFIDTSLIVP
jgi:hypothetical protein